MANVLVDLLSVTEHSGDTVTVSTPSGNILKVLRLGLDPYSHMTPAASANVTLVLSNTPSADTSLNHTLFFDASNTPTTVSLPANVEWFPSTPDLTLGVKLLTFRMTDTGDVVGTWLAQA